MQLQQNIFMLHKTFLKIPRFILYGVIAILFVILTYQTYIVITLPSPSLTHNYSKLIIEYYNANKNTTKNTTKDKVLDPIKNTTIHQDELQKDTKLNIQIKNAPTDDSTNNVKEQSQKIKHHQISFLNSSTFIQVYYSQSKDVNASYDLNPLTKAKQPPSLYISNTSEIIFMERQFRKQHDIKTHWLKLHIIQIPPFLLGDERMYQNQIMYQSIEVSLSQAWESLVSEQIMPDERLLKINLLNSDIKVHYWINERYISKFPLMLSNFSTFFRKVLYFCSAYAFIILLSMFLGLFVRYGIITLITLFLVICGKGSNFNWLNEYTNVIRKSRKDNCCMIIWIGLGMLGMYCLLALGSWWGVNLLISPILTILLHKEQYSALFIKTIFISEIFHYLFCHSRTTLFFYSRFSTYAAIVTLIIVKVYPFKHNQYFLNLHLLIQLLLSFIMLIIQQSIINSPYHSEYKPSLQKPRMLFYMGYQLSWEKGVPPMWTYFTQWFDWSYVNEKQRVYLEGDYQLLYGMMMGTNQRHQLPEQQQIQEQSQLAVMRRQAI